MIYIIGAGAIGKALAVFLKLQNKNVSLLRASVDDCTLHAEKIQVQLANEASLEADVPVQSLSKCDALNGIVVLTSKTYANLRLAEMLKNKIGISPLVLLQNGLDIEQPFLKHHFPSLYRAVLFATSQHISGNLLRFKPVNVSPVGVIKGHQAQLNEVVNLLNNHYFSFAAETNIQPVIWTKAIVNCVFNSVCPLLAVDNGIFYRNADALNIAERVIAECITIAKHKGISLNKNNVVHTLLQISRFSDGQFISTFQDLLNGRETEINSLNVAFAAIAADLDMQNAITETRLLGQMIKIKSSINLNSLAYKTG